MLRLLRSLAARVRRGSVADPLLCLNLSFVLHERSASDAVRACAVSVHRTRSRLERLSRAHLSATVVGDPSMPFDVILTARLGADESLALSLATLGAAAMRPVARIDSSDESLSEHPFFRSPAALAMPMGRGRAVVAALVLRPDGHTTHLHVAGYFDLPSETGAAICAVEGLIQTYADQWSPRRELWAGPAEELLPGEVR